MISDGCMMTNGTIWWRCKLIHTPVCLSSFTIDQLKKTHNKTTEESSITVECSDIVMLSHFNHEKATHGTSATCCEILVHWDQKHVSVVCKS